jgi:hypothetical protein
LLAVVDNNELRIAELDIADGLSAGGYRLRLRLDRGQILLSMLSNAAQEIIKPVFILFEVDVFVRLELKFTPRDLL